MVFTRFPEPGTTKTRLTPALGAKGAADLQRRMTEYTVQQALRCREKTPCSVEICYHGANIRAMHDWLGPLQFSPQIGRDLGERMQQAFAKGLTQKFKNMLIVGTDCPALSSAVMIQAFEALPKHDLVLGPSHDGGYYLIGQHRNNAFLFQNINWGTDTVFSQTLQKAKQNDLSVHTLECQHDIDHPEDLKYYRDHPGFK